jgi:hypothetical protein
MPKDIVPNGVAHGNPLGGVKLPVDAKIDASLGVLGHRLAETGEAVRQEWPHDTLAVGRE